MKMIEPKEDKRKCKGIVRGKIATLTHDDYKSVFFNQREISADNRRMQSIMHIVYNVNQHKIALSYADDKRAWFSNNFSLPYGHWLFNHFNTNPPDDADCPTVSRDTEQLYDEIYNDVLMDI